MLLFNFLDEISLIGCSLLSKIDIRCRQAKSCHNLPFGGLFVILLGDIKQLPPVKDRSLYGSGFNSLYSAAGQKLYLDFEACIKLSTSFRQNEEQSNFRQLLDRIADGRISIDDWNLINSRSLNRINPEPFLNSLRLFDIKNKVNQYNESKLREFDHVYKVKSINNCRRAKKSTSAEANNLENTLYLSLGCRIMLRRNL